MSMTRIMVQIPKAMKEQLDALRRKGMSASGVIRSLLAQHLARPKAERKGR